MRVVFSVGALAGATSVACGHAGDEGPGGQQSFTGLEDETSHTETDTHSSTSADSDADSSDDGSADTSGDGDGDGDGGEVCDATPWSGIWVGDPCEVDGDCSFEGGFCITPDDGFPCGTCSTPCEEFCDDLSHDTLM